MVKLIIQRLLVKDINMTAAFIVLIAIPIAVIAGVIIVFRQAVKRKQILKDLNK